MKPPVVDPNEAPSPGRLARAGDLASRWGSLQPADPGLRRGLHFGLALVILLGVGLTLGAALGDLPEVEWRLRPLWLAGGVAGFFVLTLVNAELWRRLLRALGPELPPLRSTSIWLTSGLGRYVPTSLMLPMVRAAMTEREGVPKRVCLASVVYEYALTITAGLVVGALYVIGLPALDGHDERFLVVLAPLGCLAILQPRVFHRFADVALERLGREPLPRSLGAATVCAFVGGFVVVYLITGLSVYALGQLVYPLSGDDLPTVIGASAAATVLGIFAFVLPAGLVAREAALAVTLAPVMPTAPAVAVAVLSRIAQIGAEVVLALGSQLTIRLVRGRETPRD